MRSAFPLFVAAFLTDSALYLAFAALPFRAIELGAGPSRLGILPTLYAGAYMSCASVAGRLSDRTPRLALARVACAVFVLGCAGIAASPTLPVLFLAIPVLGLALAFFWSPVQAELADRFPGPGLAGAVSAFNVSWSLGKGAGLVVGGILTEALRPQPALLFAGAPILVTLAILPRARSAARAGSVADSGAAAREPDPASAFLRLAWLTNAIAFGVGSTMNVHAPKYLLAHGAGPSAFGVLIGSVFLAQTATFAALRLHRPRPRTLVVAYALAAAALTAFLFAPTQVLRWAAALPLGVALGLAYQSSIHTSLDRTTGRGRAAGLHEMILGAGSSSLPLAGGAIATVTGSLAAPFWLGVGALVGGLAVVRIALRGAGAGR
jgi:MFS family permease